MIGSCRDELCTVSWVVEIRAQIILVGDSICGCLYVSVSSPILFIFKWISRIAFRNFEWVSLALKIPSEQFQYHCLI